MPIPARKITDRQFLDGCPPKVAALFYYWERQRGDRAMPTRRDMDPAGFADLLPHMLLIDVEGQDSAGIGIFRYRLIGTAEAALRGFDPTGRLVREGFFGPSEADVIDCYEMVRRSGSFLYDPLAYHTPDGQWMSEFTLFLPISEDGRRVSQILVYSEPNLDGS